VVPLRNPSSIAVFLDLAFRILAAGNAPEFLVISEFRGLRLEALLRLIDRWLRLGLEMQAKELTRAIDRRKVRANARKRCDEVLANSRGATTALGEREPTAVACRGPQKGRKRRMRTPLPRAMRLEASGTVALLLG